MLTILMPCLNEAETLGLCINKAKAWASNSGVPSEILIADNGSTDGSQSIAESLGARVIQVAQRGYGSALFHGCMAAKGEWIILGDADDSYDFSKLDLFVSKLRNGYDLVMGNRFAGGISPGAMPWKNRYIGNPILSGIGRLLFKCPAKDFHCGLRALKKSAFHAMDLRTTGMEFASEMVIKANLLGMTIAEVPTTLSKDGRSRPPHLRPWRDGWRHLRFMLLFSPRWLFITPGSFIFFSGLVAYVSLLIAPVRIGNVTFDVHTLFYAEAGVILGFLFVSIGVITKMFAMREGLLREDALFEAMRKNPVFEMGISAGLGMLMMGLYWGVDSLIGWSAVGFGTLSPGAMLRTISLSTTLIMLGGIIVMTGMVAGFMTIPTRGQNS